MLQKCFELRPGSTLSYLLLLLQLEVLDIASLIYSSYKIHKKSDSSAAKELAKVRDQLEESLKQLINMKECLSDIPNSM